MRPNVPPHKFVVFSEEDGAIPASEPGDVVVACGAKTLNELQKAGVFPKNRTVAALRGKSARPAGQGWYTVTFDPFMSTSDPTKRDEIDWDVRLATRLMLTGSMDPVVGDYAYVSSFKSLIARIEALHAETKRPVEVACDTETMSFFPWYPDRDILSISFTMERGTADVLYLGPQKAPVTLDHSEPIFDQVQWLLTSPKVRLRLANGKYDLIWIAEKWGIECTNFKFDSMLAGSLVDENRNNSLNNHAKVYTEIGGYDDCPAVGTRVCTADLRWVPIEDVKPGDKLVGFEEQTDHGLRRKMRVAEAVSSKRLMKPGVEVVFDNGTVLRCSADHGFVAHRRPKGNGPFEWVRANALRPGCRVMLVVPVEQEDSSREAGYLAGLYDGEGYVSKAGAGMVSGISQRPGVVWDRYCQGMAALGFGGFYACQRNADGVMTSKHSGWETLRLLQVLRPQRLLDKHGFEDHCVPSGAPQVRVVSVLPIGDIEVVSLQTTTRTFVTEGIASHNSFNAKYDKGHMEAIPADDEYLTYAGGDTDACQQASDVIREELLEDTQLANFYVTILHPAARAFEKMERRGVLVDQQRFAVLRDDLRKEINEQEKIALELLPTKLRIKHREKIEDQLAQGKSPLTSAILKDYFFGPSGLHLKPMMLTGKTKEPSTARAHLKMFFDHPDAKAMGVALETHGSASKTLSTFVDGFLSHLRPDGMLHPTYFLGHAEFEDADDEESGTVTGRLSAKNPAFQCCVGSTLVETARGQVRIDEIVAAEGAGYRVRTHTGAWRSVVGVYRNGVRPVFRVELASGAQVTCTANHPLLTQRGWVRTDELRVGDVGYSRKSKCEEARPVIQPGVPILDRDEEQVLFPDEQGLGELRGAGDHIRSELGAVRAVPDRYGASSARSDVGASGQRRRVLEGELSLGDPSAAAIEPEGDEADLAQRGNPDRSCLGEARGNIEGEAALSPERGPYDGRGSADCEEADRSVFQEDLIVSITPCGEQETYDLTIDRCHSFVANGVVVHNTLPKKTKWAKRLRGCYVAPPGKAILSLDFSQGELRVVACVAPEKNMIHAYENGLDLHAVTGAKLAGIPIDEFMLWKDNSDTALAELFEKYRGNAKPANFGLLYGMGPEGFQAYAWLNYGLKMTLEEAAKTRNAFFELYPGLTTYHDRARSLVRLHKMVRAPLGRVRHLPTIDAWDREVKSRAERQAINSPIQSTLTDMMIWSIALIEDAYGDDIATVGMIHDAMIAYVDADKVELRAKQAAEIMSNLPFKDLGWNPQLRFPADAEWSASDLAHMQKLKLVA